MLRPFPTHFLLILFVVGASAADTTAPSVSPARDDAAFCKEVLILHHSHAGWVATVDGGRNRPT